VILWPCYSSFRFLFSSFVVPVFVPTSRMRRSHKELVQDLRASNVSERLLQFKNTRYAMVVNTETPVTLNPSIIMLFPLILPLTLKGNWCMYCGGRETLQCCTAPGCRHSICYGPLGEKDGCLVTNGWDPIPNWTCAPCCIKINQPFLVKSVAFKFGISC
jgi:hypothetical protein